MKSLLSAIVAAVLAVTLAWNAPASAQRVIPYSHPMGWEINQLRSNGQVVACEAIHLTGFEEGLFFRHDRINTSFGFSSFASAASPFPIDVYLWFDGSRQNAQRYAMQPVKDHIGIEWRALVLPNSEPWGELDLFANASTIHFAYDSGSGMHEVSFALTGSSRATQETYACVQQAVSAPPPAAPAPPAARPALPPLRAPEVKPGPALVYGSCKLIVRGQLYVDMNLGCPIWLDNGAYGGFWINTDRNTYMGQFFAQIDPDRTGSASGWWNGQPGSTHAQSPLGSGFRKGNDGCWSNGLATVCASW